MNSQVSLWSLAILIAIILDVCALFLLRRRRRIKYGVASAGAGARQSGAPEASLPITNRMNAEGQGMKNHRPLLTSAQLAGFFKAGVERYRTRLHFSYAVLAIVLEICIIVGWAFFAGRKLLNFDPFMWPYGNEFALSVRANFFWSNLTHCGACAFWNGSMNGGYPALIDLQGAPLHPLAAIPALVFGVVNGAKLTVILCLAMAGLAQWWLARLMGLERVARVWVALMAVVAGSLGGKMENGLITLPLSTAAATLIIPAGLNLAQRPNRRAAILLGIFLALAIVSGQGYLQIGMVLGILPALLILYVNVQGQPAPSFKKYLLAIVMGLLLAAVFLVPLALNSGHVTKDTDPYFATVQPLEYLPLNLVIRNNEFFLGEVLGHLPYPYLYVTYIGWVPLLLAAFALRMIPRERTRLLLFFLAAIALVYLNSSMIVPKLLFSQIAREFLIGIRHPSLMAGLAAPLFLGLAAWGLDYAIHAGPWVSMGLNEEKLVRLRLSWIILIVPLVWAIFSAFEFSTGWLVVNPLPEEARLVFDEIKLTETEWVYLPYGEHYWSVMAMERNLKLTNTFHPWHLVDRETPPARIIGERNSPDLELEHVYATVDGIVLAKDEQTHYAAVKTAGRAVTPCTATARGGWIDVHCPATAAGTLVVQENNWPGWQASVDNQRVPLEEGAWLSVRLAEGEHFIRLRYRPWEIPLGLALSLVGVGMCVYLWRKET